MMGFFSKKSAPAAARTKAAPPNASIAITGLGIASYAGDKPLSLICAIQGQMNGVRLSNEYKLMSNNGEYVVPRMAPVKFLHDETDRERMYALTTIALKNASAQLPTNVSAESILIVIVANPELLTRFNKIDTQHLQEHLTENSPRLATATFRVLPNNANSSSHILRTFIAELNEGKWQAVIFGGGDSLISIYTCQDLHRDNRLNVVGKRTGIVPGEGAAFVVLQNAESAKTNTTPVLAYLRGLGVAAEHNARDSDIEATEGLSAAINQAITQAGITATDIQGIVHNLGAETVHALEWYQTSKKIWPRQINEQQRMAVQLGEIEQPDISDDPIPDIESPYLYLGELGAAALPMHLATALAWMEYDALQARWGFPIRNHLLVCDTPDTPERGALIISATLDAVT